MPITHFQFQEMLARVTRNKKRDVPDEPRPSKAVEREAELHQQILDECRRRGWIPLHGSMAHRAFRTKGEWDFTLVADNQRVFFIEAKTSKGKLSPDQEAIHAWARKLGHEVHTVRSFEDFLDAIR